MATRKSAVKKAQKRASTKTRRTAKAKKVVRYTPKPRRTGPVPHHDPVNEITKDTIVSFVLDETGSMASCKDATISGFNEYVKTLRGKTGSEKLRFTLTRFNSDKVDTSLANAKIKDVPALTQESYVPAACTPLYDAIGRTIRTVEADVKAYSTKPAVLLIIMTDGEENSSKEYTREMVQALIEEKKKDGWTVVFLGANIDSYKVGATLGVAAGNTMNYTSSHQGATIAMRSVALGTTQYLKAASAQSVSFFAGQPTDKLPEANDPAGQCTGGGFDTTCTSKTDPTTSGTTK